MCAQLNSPLGPSHNNKQSITSKTRPHFQQNYQPELIRTGAWNEFGWDPASFFCCVPEHSCEWARFCAAHANVNYGAQKTVVCLSPRAKSILTKETVSTARNFNHGDTDRTPHFLQECLWYQCSIGTRQYTDFFQLVPHRKQEKVRKANKDCREVIVCWLDCTFVTINLCFPCFWTFRWFTVVEAHFRTAWKIWKTTVNLHSEAQLRVFFCCGLLLLQELGARMGRKISPEVLVQLLPHEYVLLAAPHGGSYGLDGQQPCGAFGRRI